MLWPCHPLQVLYAWSAPDVLVVAMVASTLEMGLFVTFVIGSKCDAINAVLKEYFDKVRHTRL